MADYIHPDVQDNGLSELSGATTPRFDITSQQATTRTEAITTYTLGNKTSISIGAPTAGTGTARKVVVATFTGGAITGTGTASHFAITDGTRLLAAGDLSASVAVAVGGGSNTFSMPATFDITIPGAA